MSALQFLIGLGSGSRGFIPLYILHGVSVILLWESIHSRSQWYSFVNACTIFPIAVSGTTPPTSLKITWTDFPATLAPRASPCQTSTRWAEPRLAQRHTPPTSHLLEFGCCNLNSAYQAPATRPRAHSIPRRLHGFDTMISLE